MPGNTAANLLVGAGGVSNSSGQSTGSSSNSQGIGPLLGAGASIVAASDRRLKTNIRKIGALTNGLGVYSYKYKFTGINTFGVMADEVEEKFPEAMGPTILGYKTVNYSKLMKG